ncbi:putative amidoligase enzyme-domain-containing protein [Annulohypoxylon bovei var. microspora]|nr:putative amidoligase enzyme-domain-containing protein [Annulohypoxylon bovei var. microspora]
MSTQNQNLPRARPRSFGVEFEIIVPWIWDDEPDLHQELATQLSPMLRLPVGLKEAYNSRSVSDNEIVIAYVYTTLADTLEAHGLPTENLEATTGSTTGSSSISTSVSEATTLGKGQEYNKWGIKRDNTIRVRENGYKCYGVEIVSPVERASPEAFQLISYALNVLKSKYRITVNPTCGFHVHVGDGPERMPLEHVKRVAGLLWAADPLLACIHPPHRRISHFSQSIRERSNLARGRKARQKRRHDSNMACCIRYLGGGVRYGESPISWREKYHEEHHIAAFEETREPGHFEPFFMKDPNENIRVEDNEALAPSSNGSFYDDNLGVDIRVEKYMVRKGSKDVTPTPPYVSKRNRKTPRFAYPVYDPEKIDKNAVAGLEEKAAGDIGVFAGVREIFSSRSSCVIEWLLGAGERPNYNLNVYACWNLEDRGTRPGTIEFREAAGTIDGRWAETWARICVGLTDFAIHAPVSNYLSVLYNIHRAASEGAPYDVLDLLDEVGLSAEAELVEERLFENKEDWGLEFVPEFEIAIPRLHRRLAA